MKTLKTLVLLFFIVGVLSFNGCSQNTNTAALLENTETRNEIFNTIANDPEMMSAFMETMQSNENAMQMVQGNTMMMGHMMKGNGMQMMMKDSMMGNDEMMHSMMEKMMKDGQMMNNMMQMMKENDMMSQECLDNMSKMMEQKGMASNKMKN